MEMNSQLKRRFCKESGIPISIYQEPYFSERIKLYNKVMEASKTWNTFQESFISYTSEQTYYEDYNRVKDECINHIKSSIGYQTFINQNMNQYKVKNIGYPSKDVYREVNDGKWFLSIDMVQANYTALNTYNAMIFSETKTWDEFICKFTDNEHFIKSKYLRQVILGNCNPKRQVTYEKYLMDAIVKEIKNDGLAEQIASFASDEIVISIKSSDEFDTLMNITDLMSHTGLRL